MIYKIIFSCTDYFRDGTYEFTSSLRIHVKTDSESLNPVRVLYDWFGGKEHRLVGKNSIITYDTEGNISAVYSNIHFAD